MSCECAQCRQHYRTLGIAFGIPEESAIEDAYREGVKQWHPDLYENYASLRADAEEHFKQIQVAYRELKEHNAVSADTPADLAVENVVVKVEETLPAAPSISFDDAPGCLVGPHFTAEVEEIIARYMGKADTALAIVDLSGTRSHAATYSHFFLLTARGIMVRDSSNIVSLLWYKDLGKVNLIDQRGDRKLSFWQNIATKISGSQPGCLLQISRSNGTNFYSIAGQVDDSVKKVIYDFLMQRKP
ncbi:MAG: J domain-containing protein [Terracidiphilus sp.]|jgi:hypothetical protein